MGTEQVTTPKMCKTYNDDDDDDDDDEFDVDVDICHLNVCLVMNSYRDSGV